jgi:hypothetical protein
LVSTRIPSTPENQSPKKTWYEYAFMVYARICACVHARYKYACMHGICMHAWYMHAWYKYACVHRVCIHVVCMLYVLLVMCMQ